MTLEQGVGGAELVEDVVVAHHLGSAIRPRASPLQHLAWSILDQVLEAPESRAYRAANSGGAVLRFRFQPRCLGNE